MDNTILINQLYIILYNAAILSGPPLLAATVLGVTVAIFQAVTQIQDQSLPQTIKIVAIAFVIVSFGSILGAPFFQASSNLFSNFHKWVS